MMVSPTPGSNLAPPLSPTRARSVSQPGSGYLPGGPSGGQGNTPSPRGPGHKYQRSSSSNSVPQYSIPEDSISASSTGRLGSGGSVSTTPRTKGRARSSSLVAVTEVGGDAPENVVDRLGVGVNENAAWVNGPGTFYWHARSLRRLIIRRMAHSSRHDPPYQSPRRRSPRNDTRRELDNRKPRLHHRTPIFRCSSKTLIPQVSFLMFHHVTGVPFESS